MEISKQIKHWTLTAVDDLEAARLLIESGHYPQGLFFPHLYLEKLLKALIVQRTGRDAPFGHGLRALAEKAGLELSPDRILFLTKVTEYNIRGRYDDWMIDFRKRLTRDFCRNELKEIQEFGKWLIRQIKD